MNKNYKFYVCLKTCGIVTTTNHFELLKGELVMTFKESVVPAYGGNFMRVGMFEIKGICKYGVFDTDFYNEENKKKHILKRLFFEL